MGGGQIVINGQSILVHGLGRVSTVEEIGAKRLKAINLADPSMKRKYFMIHHKDKYISESLKLIIDQVFKWTAAYAKELS